MKENQALKEAVIKAIQKLEKKSLNLENVIEYIDYINKVRYSESEVITALLIIAKEKL